MSPADEATMKFMSACSSGARSEEECLARWEGMAVSPNDDRAYLGGEGPWGHHGLFSAVSDYTASWIDWDHADLQSDGLSLQCPLSQDAEAPEGPSTTGSGEPAYFAGRTSVSEFLLNTSLGSETFYGDIRPIGDTAAEFTVRCAFDPEQ